MKAYLYRTGENGIFSKTRLFDNAQPNDWISTVNVDSEPVCESFGGFGVAVTGSSCYELSTMPEEQRNAFLTDIYGEDGLNLSLARVSVGSSDYSTSVYTYCDEPFDTELKSFSVEKDREFVIPMLKEVLRFSKDIKILASPWSPPGWMKAGGFISYGYMRSKYLECYAEYLLKFVKAYGEEGIKISALTVQNEPETTQTGKSVACVWSPDDEANFALILRKRLCEEGLDTKIWLYDHNFDGWPRVLWTLKEYPSLAAAIDGVAFHYYGGGIELVDNVKKAYPDMKWHFSEGGPRLFDNYSTDTVKWASIMARAMAHGCNDFFGWNLLLDENGGPNIGPFFCAGLATLNSQTGELTYSGQYKAFKHFSKFIKPGSKIYPAELSEDFNCMASYPGGIRMKADAIAADSPDGTHALVIVNGSAEKRQAQYFYDNKWWYIELLPKSVVTAVFRQEN